MTKATQTIESCVLVGSIRRGAPWQFIDDLEEKFTHVEATLGRECREWAPGETNKAVEKLIIENCAGTDAVIFTHRSVKKYALLLFLLFYFHFLTHKLNFFIAQSVSS